MQNSDFPNLPRSWQVKTLKEIMSVKDGTHESPKYLSKGYPFVTSKNLKNNTISFDNIKYISKQDYDKFNERSKVEIGDVLFAMIGTIGNPVVITQEVNFAIKNVALFKKSNFVLPMFLKYYLETSFVMSKMQKESRGSTQKFVSLEYLRNFKIPIPPLEIQKRIIKRLDEAFSRIESGTKHLQSAKNNLIKYKQSLLKSAFNGTLTNESTKSTHPLAPSAREGERESRHALKSPLPQHEGDLGVGNIRNDDKDSLNGESANLPQGWTIKTLGEIGEIVSGGTPTTSQADNFGGNIAWITPADLSNHNDKFISQGKRNISEKGLKNSSARLMPKGTILFSSRAPIGYVAIASNPLCTNQGFKSLIPNENIFSEFVYYYLLNSKSLAESYASGTTFKEISAKSFSKLPIPIPPLETQKQIVAILERHFTSADKVGVYIDSCLTKAKQLKSSLLKSAFEGKL